MSLVDDVKKELEEMEKLGYPVPPAAYREAENAHQYDNLSVAEIASLCIDLVTTGDF